MNHASLFSGIGGFDLAAEWMGWTNIFHCEINPFCQRVLKYYWHKSISYEDIKTTDFTIHRGTIDVLTGGFPCQGFSLAGLRKGTDDDRYLWPEYLRAIREIKPAFVVGENVTGILSMGEYEVFARVDSRNIVRYADFDHYEAVYTRQEKLLVTSICKDLEKEGYKVQVFAIPAAGVGAPHKRERIWFVAHSISARTRNISREISNENRGTGQDRTESLRQAHWQASTSGINSASEDGFVTHSSNARLESLQFGRENGIHEFELTTNSTSDRRERQGQGIEIEKRLQSGPEPAGQLEGRLEGLCGAEYITNTGCSERQNWLHGKEPGREATEFGNSYTKFGAWTKFPITEPTICGGNDGIPSGLVGITVSKHRNESIKGYGNAVVPQVVLQIFKSIETYERNSTDNTRTV